MIPKECRRLAEGSGTDAVTYRIGGLEGSSRYDIKIRLAYQTLVPAFAEDLFEYSLPEVDRFEVLYQSANPEPVIMKALTFSVDPVGLEHVGDALPVTAHPLRLYPIPATDFVTIEFENPVAGPVRMSLFDVAGRRVSSQIRPLRAGNPSVPGRPAQPRAHRGRVHRYGRLRPEQRMGSDSVLAPGRARMGLSASLRSERLRTGPRRPGPRRRSFQ